MSSSIVFIHIGPIVPAHLTDAIQQAARFTPGPIYLVAERGALATFPLPDVANIVAVACEDLGFSPLHLAFREVSPFDKGFRDGFWTHTTERFFYLATLAERFGLENGVHLESDCMLYADIDTLAPKLAELYLGIAVPFDNDDRGMASFVFWRRPRSLATFCEFIVDFLRQHPDPKINDMVLLSEARRKLSRDQIDWLPILPTFYSGPLCDTLGRGTAEPDLFSNHGVSLGVIFDTIAIGQFLAGIDARNFIPRKRFWYQPPRRKPLPPPPIDSFVNEASIFNPQNFGYVWKRDARERLVPHVTLGDQTAPIANLHVHAKTLGKFASNLPGAPRVTVAPWVVPAGEIVTGERLQGIADVAVITEEKRAFHTFLPDMKLAVFSPDFEPTLSAVSPLQGARVIFVYSDLLDLFVARILPLIEQPFVLVSHTGDHGVDQRFLQALDDPKIIHWFGQNVTFRHPKLTALPIGLANSRWPHGDPGVLARTARQGFLKRTGLYVNFDAGTNRALRMPILEALADKPFAIMGRRRRPLTYFSQAWAALTGKRFVDKGWGKSFPEYLKEMAGWCYAVSPPGNGIDCHRTWEALYLGVIPVISPPLGGLLDGLPAIVVDDFSKVTIEMLNTELERLDGPFSWEKLTMSYWRDLIRGAAVGFPATSEGQAQMADAKPVTNHSGNDRQ